MPMSCWGQEAKVMFTESSDALGSCHRDLPAKGIGKKGIGRAAHRKLQGREHNLASKASVLKLLCGGRNGPGWPVNGF